MISFEVMENSDMMRLKNHGDGISYPKSYDEKKHFLEIFVLLFYNSNMIEKN